MSNTDNIKQLIINSEINIEKINTILRDKEISQLDSSEKELIETLLSDLKELGKNIMKNDDTYITFYTLISEELYLLKIREIIKYGEVILKTMRKFYKDFFLTEQPRIKPGKGIYHFRRRD